MRDARAWFILVVVLGTAGACAGKRLNTVGNSENGEGGGDAGRVGSSAAGITNQEGGGTDQEGGRTGQDGARCSDGVRNGTESDVDCGGDDCSPCREHQHCNGGGDCESNECGGPTDNDTCEPLHCGNHVQDLDEGDVDCGGEDCDRCEEGQLCELEQDCLTGSCLNGQCVRPCNHPAACGDQGWCEEGACRFCRDSNSCGSRSCGSSEAVCACRTGYFVCVAPGCDNGVQDGTESDVDCGGADCEPCETGLVCGVDQDCTSGVCSNNDTFDNHCFPEHCGNRQLDADETDVDCGGSDCVVCSHGRSCNGEDDCEPREECRDEVCVQPCTEATEQLCGALGQCVDSRCVECETVDECVGNTCGIDSTLACRNRICQCGWN
jgi:hypothetical protein